MLEKGTYVRKWNALALKYLHSDPQIFGVHVVSCTVVPDALNELIRSSGGTTENLFGVKTIFVMGLYAPTLLASFSLVNLRS